MNSVTILYCSLKSRLSQEFHYMKCQVFSLFPDLVMAQLPLRKKNKVVVKWGFFT